MVFGPSYQRRAWYSLPVVVLILAFMVSIFATQVGAIARGYTTEDAGLQTGMVVALSTGGGSMVERASQETAKRVVGVAVTPDAPSVAIGSEAAKVLVESEGEVEAYVSDLEGQVKRGDLLVLSPIKGVLMKVPANSAGSLMAIAAADVSTEQSSNNTYQVEYNGSNKTTHITKLKVNLNRQGSSDGQIKEESPLAKLGEAIVGKKVGEARVLIALVLFVIVLISEGTIIYGAVSSAITALGRNPLARKAIRQELLQVLLVAVAVLIVGLGAVYGVLWF